MSRLLLPLLALAACSPSGSKESADSTGGSTANSAPTADAGVNVSGTTNTAVTVNGSSSSDPDGDTLRYDWSFVHVPEGSALATREAPFSKNHSADATQPSFTPDVAGTYLVQLVVNDGHVDSSPDQVVVTITASSELPVAKAGTDQSVAAGTTVTLDGSNSYDPKGLGLTYAWTLVDRPDSSSASLSDTTAAQPTLATDARGTYIASLVVYNGSQYSSADTVSVTATGTDHAPTANAGADQLSAEDCTTVNLDCSASADPDGDTLQYVWEIQSKPATSALTNDSFSDRTAAKPTLYLDQAGDYTFSCAVSDGTTWSTPDTMKVKAAERSVNSKPVVDAGAAQTFDGGTGTCKEDGYAYSCKACADVTATLGADAVVTDPDGDPITYTWSLKTSDGSATITSANSLSTTVTLEDAEPTEPNVSEDTTYEFQLTATDCTGATTTDTVVLTVSCLGEES